MNTFSIRLSDATRRELERRKKIFGISINRQIPRIVDKYLEATKASDEALARSLVQDMLSGAQADPESKLD